jgi:RNA polymerase sigma factor (sigma-70 family)
MTNEEILSSDLTKSEKFTALMKKNASLIRREASKFRRSNNVCDSEDYEQEALSALFLRIIDNYDPKEGAKFSTYLTSCIRNIMKKEASKFSGPFTVGAKMRRLVARFKTLSKAGSTDEKIQRDLSLSDRQYVDVKTLAKLNRIDWSILNYVDEIPHEMIIEESGLSDAEKRVVQLRHGGATLRGIGDALGFSPEWIRHIEANAIKKIRGAIYD